MCFANTARKHNSMKKIGRDNIPPLDTRPSLVYNTLNQIRLFGAGCEVQTSIPDRW